MASMTAAEIIEALNTSYQTFGYAGVGNNPTEITEENVASIAVLPESMRNNLFKELNRTISQRWFTNSINESAKGLFRFLIRNEGGYGFGITDRFVNLIQPTQYPGTDAAAAADLVARKASPIDVHHFSDPYNPGGYYGATIDRQNMRKFCTPEGLVRYVEMIESNLFQSAEYGIMTEIAGMIKGAVEGGSMLVKPGYTLNTPDGLATTVEDMMTATDAFRQPTALYNVGQKVMSTPEDADVVIVTTPSRWNRVRARLYADRYHLDQLYVNGKVIYAPEGTDLGTYTYTEGGETKTAPVQFVALDARGFVLEITTMELRDFDVANRNYINQFLHVEGVKASAPLFVNCVGFAGEYGAFRDGGDSPEPEQKDIILTAIASTADNNVSLNGTSIGTGTDIDDGGLVNAKSVPVKPGDVVSATSESHGAYAYIYSVDADGVLTKHETTYTVTGEEYAIIAYGAPGF